MEASRLSFKSFVMESKPNRIALYIAAVIIIIQLVIFKYLYPFASYIHGDSFFYIRAAQKNLSISTYPIGYSKFLRLFSVFSSSDYVLTAFQYLFIQCSAIFLLLTLFYFLKPGRLIQIILAAFIIFNPLSLHLGNLISSDGLFLAISYVWFSLLIWIIYRPSRWIIICQSLVIFVAFTVRHNALIYPFITCLAFGISRLSLSKKLLGISLSVILCGSFLFFTMFQYKQLTGYWQYSPFSGWQLANNAMYAYRYVNKEQRKPVPVQFRELDKMICTYFDTTRDLSKHPEETLEASTVYMWTPTKPLMMYSGFKNDTTIKEFKKWASIGPIYKDYGAYLIKQYPVHFLKHFLLPNSIKYYSPPVEFLQYYNSRRIGVPNDIIPWFKYRTAILNTRMKDNKVKILDFYPLISGVMNITMLFLLCFYISQRLWQINKDIQKGIIFGIAFWICNAAFTIFASSAALRFQSFPITLSILYTCILGDFISKLSRDSRFENSNRLNERNPKNQLIPHQIENY